ncbi:hypothetical protein CPB83DRAFT_611928 [Crepidotus variabilis]|uniref:Uncharacterized protein n=1 Tax=Crepidotus variabilis TaxID=179855 RepID=A0A9P6E8M7_9AGAR|nr:hypothetical protein CPB83DRAFT_611928 [Crepidotus variabilis]
MEYRQPNEPILPEELERKIFVLASRRGSDTAYTLIQVAKRVQTWIEPLLYQVFLINVGLSNESEIKSSPFLPRFEKVNDAKGADLDGLQRQAKFVRHFMYTGDNVQYIARMLSLCTSITDLALWWRRWGPETKQTKLLVDFISNLQLEKLSIRATLPLGYPECFSVDKPLAQSLTHFDLFGIDGSYWNNGWRLLLKFPLLTHLAVAGRNIVLMIEGVLNEMDSVQLLIDATGQLYYDAYASTLVSPPTRWYAEDPRFVSFEYPRPTAGWLKGTIGGDDLWAAGYEKQQRKRNKLSKSREIIS